MLDVYVANRKFERLLSYRASPGVATDTEKFEPVAKIIYARKEGEKDVIINTQKTD